MIFPQKITTLERRFAPGNQSSKQHHRRASKTGKENLNSLCELLVYYSTGWLII
jgi:hypothetical protein